MCVAGASLFLVSGLRKIAAPGQAQSRSVHHLSRLSDGFLPHAPGRQITADRANRQRPSSTDAFMDLM